MENRKGRWWWGGGGGTEGEESLDLSLNPLAAIPQPETVSDYKKG